jgi:hypothetical protein
VRTASAIRVSTTTALRMGGALSAFLTAACIVARGNSVVRCVDTCADVRVVVRSDGPVLPCSLVQCGFGSMRYVTGDRYAGEWKDGKRHGIGLWTASVAASSSVIADANADVKSAGAIPALRSSSTCHRYHGEWRDNLKHGRGLTAQLTVDGWTRHWSVRYESDALVREEVSIAGVALVLGVHSGRQLDATLSASDNEDDDLKVVDLPAACRFAGLFPRTPPHTGRAVRCVR